MPPPKPAQNPVAVHLATLSLTVSRSVALAGNGSRVHQRLVKRLLPRDDPRCGVLSHTFQYGGSVPEGWADETTLVLADATIETLDYDVESNTWVKVRAVAEARADELERLVKEVVAELEAG
jgi:hypothetical protein